AVPQQPAQDLAGGGLGDLAYEHHTARPLERREVGGAATEYIERLEREPGRLGHDERHHALSPLVVRLADHGHVAHVRMPRQHVLDLHRVDVLAAADDHVVHAAGHVELAVGVQPAHVAGEVPAV